MTRCDEDGARVDLRLSSTDRTETMSDGVFAIAITLLVLDVHVPTAAQRHHFGGAFAALLAQWPTYVSYLATFLTVAFVWMNHHAIFARVRYVDQPLQWINMIMLLGIAFTPFPTALLADSLHDGLTSDVARVAAATYALVFLIATAPWILFWNRLARHPYLLEPSLSSTWARRERRRGAVGVVAYSVAVPAGYIFPPTALALFVATALFYGITASGFHE